MFEMIFGKAKKSELDKSKFQVEVCQDCVIALRDALLAHKHNWTGYERSLVNQSLGADDEWLKDAK